MQPIDITVHSGGALGADFEWERIGRSFGVSDFRHYWHGNRTPYGNVQLTDAEIEQGWQHVLLANKTLKRRPQAYKSLLGRNWWQVKPVKGVYAISKLNKQLTQVAGGTGWAVQMAVDSNTPVVVFDQILRNWFIYNKVHKYFIECGIPKLQVQSACIGTRNINNHGTEAIYDIYTNTFNL